MGDLSLESLEPVEVPRAATEALRSTQLVGARMVVDTTSAMRLQNQTDGDVLYVGEEKIHVANVRRKIEMANGTNHSWLRLEIKMPRGGKGQVGAARVGDTIQVTEYPWTGQWHQFAELKGTNKRSADERSDNPADWSEIADVRDAIQDSNSCRTTRGDRREHPNGGDL